MTFVLDASVIIKWFSTTDEDFKQEALLLYQNIQNGEINIIQPIHWQAEVIAVLARLLPEQIDQIIPLLNALEFDTLSSTNTYQRAAKLSTQLNHHLFDTLYHAVALNQDILLVTDDRKYYQKANAFGNICLLADIQQHLNKTAETETEPDNQI